jgi:Fe-S-cluster containining protein
VHVSRERVHAAATAAFERTMDALARGGNPERCASLCERTNTTLEQEFERLAAAGSAVSCLPGCAFCCHQRVSIFPHEAVALWQALRERLTEPVAEAVANRVRENARRVDEMSRAQHQAANLPCAFLIEGHCSAYALRPSVCASFHSMSRARCEQSFQRPDGIGTPRNSRPALLELQAFADAVIEATSTALVAAGLDNRKVELHQALRALLDDEAAADRWRAGGALCAAGGETGAAS